MPTFAKNNLMYAWTAHSRAKMRFYGLSESRVKKVISAPERIESGVAPDTIALMQTAGTAKHPYEIWAMLEIAEKTEKVISVWKYPGRTKPGEPLPEEILTELKSGLKR